MATSKLTPFDGKLDDEQPASALTPFTGQLDGEKPRTRGLFEAVNDNVIEFANAAAGGVSALANFVKPGNAVSGFIDENIIKAGEQKQSDVVQGAKRQLSEGLQNAQGIGDEVGAVGSYVLNNPLLAASQAAGSFALPGGAVKGAGSAAGVLGAGAKGIETAGRVGGIAAGAAMAGGDAAGTAYDLASKAGATDEQATAAGRQASVIPALVGGVTGAFGAERLLAGAKGFGGNALSRGLKSGLSEAGQEALEEGVTQFEGQRAAMPYDESIDPTKGVAGAAAMGGIMGFGPGAVLGAMGEGSKPSQQMGIDPSAGPLSRAAATSVDSQPVPQPLGASITGTVPADLMGRATDPLAAQIAEGRQQSEDRSVVQVSPAAASEPVPLEQRSLEELRQAFRSAQDPAIRKTLAAEIRKRREAMPDPLAPVQPQQEISLEPQASQAVQSQPQEAQAPAEPAVLGQPLTDTGTNMLGRGADPLQSIIQGQADARRAADELRGTTGASTVTGGDITPPSVESPVADVRSGGRNDDAGTAQPDANGDAGGAVGSTAQGSAALRPDNWRGNAIKAGKVARSLGLDPKGKRLKEIVAEIDAVDAGSGIAAKPVSREQAIRDAWRKEPRTIGKWTPISVEAEGQKADMLVNQKRAGGDKDGALHVVNIRMGKMLKDMEREPIAYTFRLTADNRLVEEGIPTVATPGQIAAWKGAGFALDDKPANVQNTPSSTAGTETKASPVEARAPEGGNAAADTGVPAAPGAGDVQADGVNLSKNPRELNTSAEPVQKTSKNEQVAQAGGVKKPKKTEVDRVIKSLSSTAIESAPDDVLESAKAFLESNGYQRIKFVTVDGDERHSVAAAVARSLGKTYTVYRPGAGSETSETITDGLSQLGGDHIFVSSDVDNAPLKVAFHEVYHSLPDSIRKPLNEQLFAYFKPGMKDRFIAENNGDEEEAAAHFADAISTRRDFWESLKSKLGKSEFGRIVNAIIKTFDTVVDKLTQSKDSAFLAEYIADVEAARDALAQAYAEAYQVAKAPSEPANPEPSKAAQPKAEKPAEDDAFMGVEDDAPIFYSALRKEIEGLNLKSAPFLGWHGQLQGLVRAGKVKADELEWTGISEWLKLQTGKVSKDDVLAYLDANGVQVTETVLGEKPLPMKEKYDRQIAAFEQRLREDMDNMGEDLLEQVYKRFGEEAADEAENDPDSWPEWLNKVVQHARDESSEFEQYENEDPEAKYSQYTLPGGENYREVLLTLPDGGAETVQDQKRRLKETYGVDSWFDLTDTQKAELKAADERANRPRARYKSSHWDQPNVLAHIRLNDRTDADGKRVLFVEEIQSDWGQEGKKKGFVRSYRLEDIEPISAIEAGRMTVADEKLFWFFKAPDNVFAIPKSKYEDQSAARDYIVREKKVNSGGVVAAPFVDKTDKWLALSLKRIMKMAVDGGYDRVAFVNGEQSAERYDLSKQVNSISWTHAKDGTYNIEADTARGEPIVRKGLTASELENTVGKEVAQKIVDGVGAFENDRAPMKRGTLSGVDLKVGGEGMKAFYDKIVPAAVKDVLKKVGGGQMEAVDFDYGDGKYDIWLPDSNSLHRRQDFASLKDAEQFAKDVGGEVHRNGQKLRPQPGFTITDSMREKVAGGLPLFAGTKDKAKRQGTPVDRAIMDMAGEGREANEILSFIAKSSKSPYRRQLAQKLLATGANPAVSLGGEMGGGAGFRFLAKYSRKNHEVTLSEAAADRAEQIFLHETVHSATLLALDKGGLIATQMRRLAASVYKDASPEMRKMYGLVLDKRTGEVNVGEFVAEAFTNPDFQKALKGMKADNGSLWDRLVNIVRRILGMEPKEQDALSAALDLGAKVMRENMPLRAARSFRAEDGPAFAGSDQTETPAFRKWFGGSKVVDAQGKPLVSRSSLVAARKAAMLEGRMNGGASNAKSIADLLVSQAFSLEGLGGLEIPAQREVLNGVLSLGDDLKVLGSVVDLVPVDVVNILAGKNLAPEVLFRDEAVLKQLLSADRDGSVSTAIDVADALVLAVTRMAAKGPSIAPNPFFRSEKGRAAADTGETGVLHGGIVNQTIGNNGNFDPDDADIAHFGMADAVEQIKAFDVKSAPKNTWAHYRGMALQTLGRRQLVDLYGDEFGTHLHEYDYLVQQMDAEKNETGAEADDIAQRWGKLKDEKALAELMHDATLAKMDPDKPMPAGYSKSEYDKLKTRFNTLSPEAKTLYREARDMYVAHYKAVQQAIKDRIERSEMSPSEKKRMMASLDDKLFKELQGVYFPLARFGQYVIVVKDANGEVKNVTRAETVKEAEQARKELQKAFPAHMGNTVGKVLKQAEFNAGRDAVGKGFMADLMNALDEKGVDDELRDTVAQLYLSSLPDLSWAKHGIHRKGTPGFSQDARRAFAQNAFHGARYLAKLRYSDRLQDELAGMQEYVKAFEGVEEYDSIQGQQVVDEMVKRHEILMNPKSSPVSTALTSFGFLFHMGLSPASAMVNLTQTALVAYPQMGAKWGFGKAGAALTKASEEVVRAKNDLSKSLKGDELSAFERAVKDGTIDVTMAHDLAGIAQGEDQGVMWKVRPVMRWASFMFHHAEKFNRQATFLAAYRLSKETNQGRSEDWHYEEAKKATYDGHFDYSAANRARIMQGNWQRVILLFKQYSQSMIYTLARNAYQSVKAIDPKERTQARKTLGGILAAHAAAAGVLGLPIVGPLLTVASWIGGDDDEPWDAEIAMQNAMAEMIGPKAAEVVARGFSRLTPFDLSGRVALNKLILPDVQEGLEGKEWAESAMAAALGPVAGIGVNMARGAQKITEGDYLRGMEDMMPTALRGPLKALRYANEGAVDKTGIVITDEVSAAGVLGQASGFSPSQVRRDTERRSAIYAYDRALLERRSVLMRMMAEARIQGDEEAAAEVQKDIQRFNEKNPSRRITPMNIAQSIRNRRKRVEQAEQGVFLPKNRRDAMDQVRF